MSLFSLKDVRNHPRRSAFDLSSKVAFSAKSGELLPIKWYFTMPGDKFTLKRQHFTRTQPVNTSAYTRIREYYDWFWVPLHLLWRNAPEVISQMQSNVQHAGSQTSSLTLGNYLPVITSNQLGGVCNTLLVKKIILVLTVLTLHISCFSIFDLEMLLVPLVRILVLLFLFLIELILRKTDLI